MKYLILCFSFLAVFLSIYGVYLLIYQERFTITRRMQEIASNMRRKPQLNDELSKPFIERIFRPLLLKVSSYIGKLTPTKKKVSLQKKLVMAGNPGNLSPSEFAVIQYGFTIVLPIAVLLVSLPLSWSPGTVLLFMTLACMSGIILPDYYLKMCAGRRREEVQDNLPDVLDLLTVSVEAGLGFDAALVKVVEKTKGVVSREFNRVLQEIKMGKPRRDALRDLGNRSGVDDMVAFVGSIIQADQLGVSIGNVLRLQSEQMRQKRRQRAEEKAMKAPIKMLIPLILFIFPTIFIVVLGPAAIQIMDIF
ncbi:type II secretion system F family protein [Phosphitispora fastidiosa]|uniref:type II secretion system F family protein n=1 Tax=Phosphitispora fastidiosa TaxID=2837202 RepID=UPI001E347B79|nr:type II secretion system F family protein [Phosphitispora fastidiosa]MBU7008233.1 tight adherence protein C [Phosphitispora fastidiosa]